MPASGAAKAKGKGGATKESDKEKARTKFYSHSHKPSTPQRGQRLPVPDQTRVRTQSESGEGRKRLTRTRSGCSSSSSSQIQDRIARSPAAVRLRRSSGDPAPFSCRASLPLVLRRGPEVPTNAGTSASGWWRAPLMAACRAPAANGASVGVAVAAEQRDGGVRARQAGRAGSRCA